jgi:hypothetical protein
MKRILATFFIITSCFLSGSAFAGIRNHKAAHVSFWVPDTWSFEGDEQSQLQVSDPKGEVALLLMLQDYEDMKAAATAIGDQVTRIATDVKMGEAQNITINGMEGVVVDATGKAEGKRVELSVLILKTPANKYLMIFGVLETEHKHAHEPELKKILASLKPVR